MAAEVVGGAFLSSFLGVVFNRLSSPEVASLIRRKKLDKKLVQRLGTTLYAVQAVLGDAEQKQIKDPAVKKWLDNLKSAVYVADDLLDEVSTKAVTQKDAGNFWSRYLNLQDREMVTKIEDIIDTLESIVKHKDILGLKEIASNNISRRTPSTSLVEGSNIYGRDEDKEAIIKLLLDDSSDVKICVIPIVGMGGIGKTTLAQLVYNDDKLKQKFDFKAWICVSEEFDILKVTKTIIEAVTSSSCKMKDLNLLQLDLKEKFTGKKFLLVLDDMWNENYDDWNILQKPFQYGIKGSKILVTTRSEKVASIVQTIPAYNLNLLSNEDCWLVFANHAFLSSESNENSTLEKIGREIVEKCKGLPLAAQTLGGLLRTKRDNRDWNNILKSDIWEFSENKSKIIPALIISYHHLPSHLKRCFVYCLLYPKGCRFDREQLILLWMAEDLIQPSKRGKALEEVGYEYFEELASRSFFQHFAVGGHFVMHDLIHDLATSIAGEFYFREEELGKADINDKTRHLSYSMPSYPISISNKLEALDRGKYIRTFLFLPFNFNIDWVKMESAPSIVLSKFKYLRVLSFNFYSDLNTLPDSIAELIHLRYLDLSCSRIKTLPESLCKLYNLQTLKLHGCDNLTMLPNGMQNLVNLRHLDIMGCSLKEMPRGTNKLKHLQFLNHFVVGNHEETGIRELGGLANLHGSVCISKLENVSSSSEALEAKMTDKKHINCLYLLWSLPSHLPCSRLCFPAVDFPIFQGQFLADDKYNSWLCFANADELHWSSSAYSHQSTDSQIERDILDNLQPHRDLKELWVECYRGTRFPNWLGHSSYHSLTMIVLKSCGNCCMLPSLGQLSSLKQLMIENFAALTTIGPEFYKNDDSSWETPFRSLESLAFQNMCCWQVWHSLEFDAFPQLKHLALINCPMLMGDLPNYLPALEILSIIGCKQLASSLPKAPAVRRLFITCSNKLTLQELPLLLHSLSIKECRMEFLLVSHDAALQNLSHFTIIDCCNFVSFPKQGLRAPYMTYFKVSGCVNLESLPSHMNTLLPELKELHIECCPKIDSFPEGGLPPNLRSLSISNCEKLLSHVTSMDLLTLSLTHLSISMYHGVKSFPKEGWLPTSLESLELHLLSNLEMLDCKGLLHLTCLRQVAIKHCYKLENMAGEMLPASLIQLSIEECPLLEKLCQRKHLLIWPKIAHICRIRVFERPNLQLRINR